MEAKEIIEKLRPTLRSEGLEVDFVARVDNLVHIRARRVSPGVPVAFLVKALAGTYRRYLTEIEDVYLAEYDPGVGIPLAPSETFEPVFEHNAAIHAFLQGKAPGGVRDLTELGCRLWKSGSKAQTKGA